MGLAGLDRIRPRARRAARTRRVRDEAFRQLLTGNPLAAGDLAAAAGTSSHATRKALADLVTSGEVTMDGDAVVGARGVTVRPTKHRLALAGVALHTWCAYDMVGITAALGANSVAGTACAQCGIPIEVSFENGQAIGSEAIRGWLPEQAPGPVVERFCPYANWFCGEEHLSAWREAAGDPAGSALTLGEMAELGRKNWGPAVQGMHATEPDGR